MPLFQWLLILKVTKIKVSKELLQYHFKKVLIYIQIENIVDLTHKNMYL